MKIRGLGCNELDRHLGRSEGYTSRLISENRTPRADTLRAIALALQVTPAWLLADDDAGASSEGGPEETHHARDVQASTSGRTFPSRAVARYPNLERAIAYWEAQRHWLPATLTAARDMQLDADEDPSPQWWTEQLDRFEAAIKSAMIHRIGEPLAGDPILEAKARRKSAPR